MYANVQEHAERTLANLPTHMPVVIADEKTHKYAFTLIHKDAASKAGGFEALGHPVRPGGTEYPLTKEMYDHGEAFKRQIIASASNRTAEVEDRPPVEIAKRGVKFAVMSPLSGLESKMGKEVPLQTVWIDKRKGEESSNGVLELVTLIPKGDKK